MYGQPDPYRATKNAGSPPTEGGGRNVFESVYGPATLTFSTVARSAIAFCIERRNVLYDGLPSPSMDGFGKPSYEWTCDPSCRKLASEVANTSLACRVSWPAVPTFSSADALGPQFLESWFEQTRSVFRSTIRSTDSVEGHLGIRANPGENLDCWQ